MADTALDNNEILHHPLKDASSKPQAIIILKASSLLQPPNVTLANPSTIIVNSTSTLPIFHASGLHKYLQSLFKKHPKKLMTDNHLTQLVNALLSKQRESRVNTRESEVNTRESKVNTRGSEVNTR